MEKNLVWAVVLSAVFLLIWSRFFAPVAPPQSQKQSAPSKESQNPAPPAPRESESGTEKTVETNSVKVVIGSRGAGIIHWWLKEAKPESGRNSLLEEMPDLVNWPEETQLSEKLPLSTYPELDFSEVRTGLNSRGDMESSWSAHLPNGVILRKTYLWESGKTYFSRLVLSFSNPTSSPQTLENIGIGWDGGLGTLESEVKYNSKMIRLLAYPSPARDVTVFKSGEQSADYAWAGLDNRYYLFVILLQPGQFDSLRAEKTKTNQGEISLVRKNLILQPRETYDFDMKLYAGPKGYTQLKQWGMGLEHSVDFGFFGFLGREALKALYFLRRLTGNFGWSIIILTAILQAIVLPLSIKSYKSMAGMKKLQPRIQELQKRYEKDPKRLNQEMLQLYRETKTNPFGGCIPMILQVPVFWAFFTMLRNSYELRGAPWVFWIRDLSQKDPYYVLPVVMGIGMFIQQKISGTAGDPSQAKMMSFMPIVFTVMFINFPSGLVLYWLTNSLLSMATQYVCSQKFS